MGIQAWQCTLPSVWKSEAEGSRIQGQPGLHSKFQASLGNIYIKTLSQKKTNKIIKMGVGNL
jgi:hypothetical protein